MALPALQLAGSKIRLAQQIISLLGQSHGTYVEPYFGTGAVLLAKPPVGVEVVNDIDHELVDFYRVLRRRATRYDLIDALVDTPYSRYELEIANGLHDGPGTHLDEVEKARRFMVRSNQTFPGAAGGTTWVCTMSPSSQHSNATKWNNYRTRLSLVASRLQKVQIDCVDGLEVLDKAVKTNATGLAAYLDPPYPADTRAGSSYRADMTDEQHLAMLDRALALPGPTVISSYPSELYSAVLGPAGWTYLEIAKQSNSSAGKGATASRIEVLWANQACIVAPPPEIVVEGSTVSSLC
jgi:DNA adenine methylase